MLEYFIIGNIYFTFMNSLKEFIIIDCTGKGPQDKCKPI